MSRIKLLLLAAAIGLGLPHPALAASSNVNSLTASGAIVGTQLFYCPIGATTDLKCSAAQIAAYNYSLMSGDCTASGTGAITCTKTSGTAFSGLAPLAGSTAGDLAYYNGTTWVRLAGNASGTNFLQETSAGVPSWAAGTSAGVSSFSSTCPPSGPSTGAVTYTNTLTDLAKTASYSGSWTTDCGAWIKFTCTAACTCTLPAPATDGNYVAIVTNTPTSSNALTIAAASGQINGGSSITLAINQSVSISCDTTNCYAATVTSPTIPQINTWYVSSSWYPSLYFGPATGNAWTTAGNLECAPYLVSPQGMTAKALGVAITTADASNFLSLAIFSTGANGRPNALIDSIGTTGIAGTPTGASSAALANGTDLISGNTPIWFCMAANSTTLVVEGISTNGTPGIIGASAIASAESIVGVVCTGGASGCGPTWAAAGGSSYTWPSSLATATWTQKIVSGQAPQGFLQSN